MSLSAILGVVGGLIAVAILLSFVAGKGGSGG